LQGVKKRIYIALSYVLLLAFINAVAPKEFLHSFHHHTETQDVYTPFSKVDSKHTHCAFLQWQLAGFDAVATVHFEPFSTLVSPLFSHTYTSESYTELVSLFLRGPPSVI
jgi:hypothetical protein